MGGRIALWLALACAGTGCIVARQSLKLPSNEETTVALLSGTLPAPMNGIARHPWFAVRKKGERTWKVYEVGGGGSEADPFTKHAPYGDPILHAMWRGEEGESAAACVEKVAPGVKRRIQNSYVFYPGPNSNTFGDVVLRKCKLSGALPSTSVGKDWRGLFGAGLTSERTGVQIETPLVGLKLGLKEGVEIHLLGLSIGIDLWPPAIILPVGPGRFGFADR